VHFVRGCSRTHAHLAVQTGAGRAVRARQIPLVRVQPTGNMQTPVNDSPTAVGDQSLAYHLSGKEILSSIQPFSGNVDRAASVLDNDTFIDFHDWLDASVWKLTVAEVPPHVRASLIAQKLLGPLQRLLIRAQLRDQWNLSVMTVSDLRSRLVALYPDATLRYTSAMLDICRA
jgi:hypothetical protein